MSTGDGTLAAWERLPFMVSYAQNAEDVVLRRAFQAGVRLFWSEREGLRGLRFLAFRLIA